MKIAIAITLVCLCCGPLHGQRKASVQTHFSAENDKVARPAVITADAWKILQRDSLVKDILEDENLTVDQIPQSWFQASVVHLASSAEKDLLVIANPPLAGGNVTTFWVFCQTPQGMKLVLTAPAHDLFIHSSRTNGHRDIELVAMTAIRIMTGKYRFDGTQYQMVKSTDEPIK
jgi:hypothetical protein